MEHDAVDLGGGVYAYTAIDIFAKQPSVYLATDLEMATGAKAFEHHLKTFGYSVLHQSDNGSEFQTAFREAVQTVGSAHRYSRPYKKNEQSHIENFNKSLRSECFPRGEYEKKNLVIMQLHAALLLRALAYGATGSHATSPLRGLVHKEPASCYTSRNSSTGEVAFAVRCSDPIPPSQGLIYW